MNQSQIEQMITLSTMDTKMKEVLDAWLKYGTVFLIYRLCSYYFFDQSSNAELFDRESLQLVLFILIGFTLYYLLIKPYIPVHLQHPIFNNIANDSLMFGTVLVSSHLLDSWMSDGDYFNKEWLKSAGLILLAFAAYRVFVNPFIPFNTMNPNLKPIVSDWAQFGSFLVALRILQGKSIFDQKWFLSVLFAMLGFTGYHLITKKLITIN
jgi:hypothetical protein